MCLILAAYKSHPKYDLILLANRDEFRERPTQSLHWWEDGDILAGKDLKAGGTWLGVNRQKQLAALTNYRDPKTFRPKARSRGNLVSNYLLEGESVCAYGGQHLEDVSAYNDFNMFFYEDDTFYYFNSLDKTIEELDAGIHGLSNAFLNTPWPKVEQGKSDLKTWLVKESLQAEEGFQILSNRVLYDDTALPDTGVGLETERFLSAMHIDVPGYGTRSSSVVLFGVDGSVEVWERDHAAGGDLHFRLD